MFLKGTIGPPGKSVMHPLHFKKSLIAANKKTATSLMMQLPFYHLIFGYHGFDIVY